MKATIDIDQSVLTDCGILASHFHEAVTRALSRLEHPETGEPIYFNGVQVEVRAASPEVKKTTTIATLPQRAVPNFANANISLEE